MQLNILNAAGQRRWTIFCIKHGNFVSSIVSA